MRHALVISALVLAGCVAQTPPETTLPPVPDPGPAACGASGLQGLVGQPDSVLAAMTFKGPVRVIPPGTAVTMDYSAERLNIATDGTGRITRVSCG